MVANVIPPHCKYDSSPSQPHCSRAAESAPSRHLKSRTPGLDLPQRSGKPSLSAFQPRQSFVSSSHPPGAILPRGPCRPLSGTLPRAPPRRLVSPYPSHTCECTCCFQGEAVPGCHPLSGTCEMLRDPSLPLDHVPHFGTIRSPVTILIDVSLPPSVTAAVTEQTVLTECCARHTLTHLTL